MRSTTEYTGASWPHLKFGGPGSDLFQGDSKSATRVPACVSCSRLTVVLASSCLLGTVKIGCSTETACCELGTTMWADQVGRVTSGHFDTG